MPRKAPWPPPIYPRDGREFVRIWLGPRRYRDITLGPEGSPAARAEYLRIVAEMEAHGGTLPPAAGADLTMVELCVAFLEREKADAEPKTFRRVRRALQPVTATYGHTFARDFGPRALRTIQQWYADQQFSRRYCNHLTGCVRRMFRWAVAEQLLPVAVADALDAIPSLTKRKRKGQAQARESPKVRPAALADVEATLPELPPALADLCRLLMASGMRPGEACAIRPADIDFAWRDEGGVRIWLYRLDEHKCDWRGHYRWAPIGPRGQAALAPWLDRPADSYCFSPREVREEWCRRHGRSVRFGRARAPGERYCTEALDKCVRKARLRAGVARWTPNMLRHLVATVIETERGREDARVVLGHSTPSTTAIYAEQVERAARVMAAMG